MNLVKHSGLILTLVLWTSAVHAQQRKAQPSSPKTHFEDCEDDSNSFVKTVVKKLADKPCGITGSIEERVADCKKKGAALKEGFALVSRTAEGKEIYQDTKNKVIWGDKLREPMTYAQAQQACTDRLPEVGRIGNLKWRLPTIDEVRKANKSGAKKALPNMSDLQWTSSPSAHNEKHMYLYNNGSSLMNDNPKEKFTFRCVAVP